MQKDLQDKIAKTTIDHYNKLPKTGKPTNQWTVLTSIVQENNETNQIKVVSLGTGTSCLSKNKLSSNGDILNDSHAEVICRRAFLRYLLEEIDLCLNSSIKSSIFNFDENRLKFSLRGNIKFHLFTTQTPCGDASIFLKKPTLEETFKKNNNSIKRSLNNEKKIKYLRTNEEIDDIYRTGAKCLKEEKQDLHLPGIGYHQIGSIRTKPGRGDPTKSLSCSDKFARWIRVGLQGAILSILIEKPILLSSICLAKNTLFNLEAFERCLFNRFNDSSTIFKPMIVQTNIEFESVKNEQSPCPSSIIWCDVKEKPLEVSVNGIKQGVTEKRRCLESSQLLITKRQIAKKFVGIILSNEQLQEFYKFNEHLRYVDLKMMTIGYQDKWRFIKKEIFKNWTEENNDLINFYIT